MFTLMFYEGNSKEGIERAVGIHGFYGGMQMSCNNKHQLASAASAWSAVGRPHADDCSQQETANPSKRRAGEAWARRIGHGVRGVGLVRVQHVHGEQSGIALRVAERETVSISGVHGTASYEATPNALPEDERFGRRTRWVL